MPLNPRKSQNWGARGTKRPEGTRTGWKSLKGRIQSPKYSSNTSSQATTFKPSGRRGKIKPNKFWTKGHQACWGHRLKIEELQEVYTGGIEMPLPSSTCPPPPSSQNVGNQVYTHTKNKEKTPKVRITKKYRARNKN